MTIHVVDNIPICAKPQPQLQPILDKAIIRPNYADSESIKKRETVKQCMKHMRELREKKRNRKDTDTDTDTPQKSTTTASIVGPIVHSALTCSPYIVFVLSGIYCPPLFWTIAYIYVFGVLY